METNTLFGSEIVLRAAIQTTEGVAEVFNSNDLYIPATEVTETSDTPTTIVPIISSPDVREVVAYTTDSISGNTLKTFLFSASSFIGKSISSATSAVFFGTTAGTVSCSVTSGQTVILGGVTATANATATVSAEDYFTDFYDYVVNGTTPSTDWTFTGTFDDTVWDVFLGDDTSTYKYLFIIAKDPLSTATPTSKTGTATGVVLNRQATTGSASQHKIPEIYPYLKAAGLAPTFGVTLELPDSLDAIFTTISAFKNAQAEDRIVAMTALQNLRQLLTATAKLDLGTDSQAALAALRVDVLEMQRRQSVSFASIKALDYLSRQARNVFTTNIANGDFHQATTELQAAAADMDGLGYITFTRSLTDTKSVTILGRTFTNVSGVTMTAAEVAAEFVSGTNLTGTITSGYSFASRIDPERVNVVKTGDQSVWAISQSSTQTKYTVDVVHPLETVYESSTLRSSITSGLAALTAENPLVLSAFKQMKAEMSRVWAIANPAINRQDVRWTNAQAGWVTDLADFSTDSTFYPNDLIYAYAYMRCDDTGILDLSRLTVQAQRLTENGSRIKLQTTTDVIVSSFDLTVMANQPPEISMTMLGEPGTMSFEDGATIDFSPARLKTMPQATKDNVTFCSLVLATDSFVNGNIALQELSFPNIAGLKADRALTTLANFYRLSADRVGRKLTLTILDGDGTDLEGALPELKTLIGQEMKFRLQVGTMAGFTYLLQVSGLLTNDQPTTSQNSLAARQVELTVTSSSLTWS